MIQCALLKSFVKKKWQTKGMIFSVGSLTYYTTINSGATPEISRIISGGASKKMICPTRGMEHFTLDNLAGTLMDNIRGNAGRNPCQRCGVGNYRNHSSDTHHLVGEVKWQKEERGLICPNNPAALKFFLLFFFAIKHF